MHICLNFRHICMDRGLLTLARLKLLFCKEVFIFLIRVFGSANLPTLTRPVMK
ncbi:hypothetical protein HanRHA438_Chr02g0048361 [Helianthus annuus]|nr:hypothetical protein HanIR_Chr02g0052601 [Helianthus annuus]KAJ0938308.1 hypothetical protein HanRHA438_Chr02g0048361 [Helianthus annuus]